MENQSNYARLAMYIVRTYHVPCYTDTDRPVKERATSWISAYLGRVPGYFTQCFIWLAPSSTYFVYCACTYTPHRKPRWAFFGVHETPPSARATLYKWESLMYLVYCMWLATCRMANGPGCWVLTRSRAAAFSNSGFQIRELARSYPNFVCLPVCACKYRYMYVRRIYVLYVCEEVCICTFDDG